MTHRPKHVVEYQALRAVVMIIRALPYRVAIHLGCAMAWIAFYIVRFRVHTAEARIRSVFGEQFTRAEARRIARLSLRNLFLSAVEMIQLMRVPPDRVTETYPVEKLAGILNGLREKGRGSIIAVPHAGNWETAALSLYHSGVKLFTFSAPQKNPLTDRFLAELRFGPGIPTIQRDSGSLRKVIRRLNGGETLAILPDVRMRTPGLAIPFLGGTANLGPGTALFAHQTGSPIVLCFPRRRGLTGLSIEPEEVIEPDPSLSKDEDVQRIMSHIIARIDAFIHEEPEQWFWFNKRWILDPVKTPPGPGGGA